MSRIKKAETKKRKSTEKLSHFSCLECQKWWTVGDAPAAKCRWFCPWCGVSQRF